MQQLRHKRKRQGNILPARAEAKESREERFSGIKMDYLVRNDKRRGCTGVFCRTRITVGTEDAALHLLVRRHSIDQQTDDLKNSPFSKALDHPALFMSGLAVNWLF